jgi:ParB family transcriptional regulator, chromosome partitioning protein
MLNEANTSAAITTTAAGEEDFAAMRSRQLIVIDEQNLEELLAAGLSREEVAEQLGVSLATLDRKRKDIKSVGEAYKRGLARHAQAFAEPVPPSDEEKVLLAVFNGCHLERQIAARAGIASALSLRLALNNLLDDAQIVERDEGSFVAYFIEGCEPEGQIYLDEDGVKCGTPPVIESVAPQVEEQAASPVTEQTAEQLLEQTTAEPFDVCLPPYDESAAETGFEYIKNLIPHSANPRGKINVFTDADLKLLAEDIKARGIIEPLVITPGRVVLCGHRRLAAAELAGLARVPVVIRELREGEFAEDYFLAENLQRANLSPLEEARAMQSLKERLTCGVMDLARRLNLTPVAVSVRLAILTLPERVQEMYHRCDLPINSATALAKFDGFPEEQEKFADMLAARRLTLKTLKPAVEKRLKELETQTERQNSVKKLKQTLAIPDTVRFDRAIAIDKLRAAGAKKISCYAVAAIIEESCCHCGMANNPEICATCPLPQMALTVAARAKAQKSAEGRAK